MDQFSVFTARTVVDYTGDGANALNSMHKALGSRMRLSINVQMNSDGVLNLVNLPVSRGGCILGSVSEIQSDCFMLGLNVWFALDATTPTNQRTGGAM